MTFVLVVALRQIPETLEERGCGGAGRATSVS